MAFDDDFSCSVVLSIEVTVLSKLAPPDAGPPPDRVSKTTSPTIITTETTPISPYKIDLFLLMFAYPLPTIGLTLLYPASLPNCNPERTQLKKRLRKRDALPQPEGIQQSLSHRQRQGLAKRLLAYKASWGA